MRPGYRLFFDPVGPFKEATLHRYKYALVVLDDFSGLVQTKLMIRLSDWFAHLTALVRRIEAEKGSERVVAQLGSDSFPAFVEGHLMIEFAAAKGIQLLASPPYTQKLNPVEGMIKILLRMALAMLRYAGAPKRLVEFALSHATLLLNRLPRERKGQGMVIPLDRWLGFQAPSVLHMLKVWGCAAYALDMGQRGKFESKVSKTVHLGYDVARSAYILCSLPHFKIAYSAHVTFNEQDFPLKDHYKPDPQPYTLCEERASVPLRHSASGEAWGCARGENLVRMDRESPDGTLRPATGLGRVSANVLHQVSSLTYPKEAGTSDGTLGPDRGLGRVSRQRQHREEPVPFPEFEGGLERPMLPRIGEEQGD